jgi:hypothetical protein
MFRIIRTTCLFCSFALLLLVIGCSKVTKANIDKVQKGMTEAEVVQLLGAGTPTTRDTTPPDMKEMTWEGGSDTIMVQFKDGKVEGLMKTHKQ